jgi:hypothetical protein
VAVKHWGTSTSARSYPLSGCVDATGQTWHEVPGYGFVNWTPEQITEQARYLFSLHRPDQTTVRVRIAWGLVPLVTWPGRYCKVCQTKWLCRTGAWAHDWLSAMAAQDRNGVEAAP